MKASHSKTMFSADLPWFSPTSSSLAASIRRLRQNFMLKLVREGASLGANRTIIGGITIGRYDIVGAGAVVTKDAPEICAALSAIRPISWQRLG